MTNSEKVIGIHLFGQTIKQPLSNFEPWKSLKYKQLRGLGPDPSCLLANSASTNCRPFQVTINCPKFILDRLHYRCHMTLLVSLFVTSRKLLFGVFLPRKIVAILLTITINFRQVSLKGVLLLARAMEYFSKILKSTCEKFKSLKKLYCTRTSSEVAFKDSSKILFTYLKIFLSSL